MAEVVGQKSAFLGEAHRLLPGRVPDGFATTEPAYREFIGRSGLAERDRRGDGGARPVGHRRQLLGRGADHPDDRERAGCPRASRRSSRRAPHRSGATERRFAVRSSALQEGGLEVSFAGQYRSLLNVPAGGIGDAFRRVVASKYSPQAITYRLGRGLEDDEVAMCCCVLAMVDAASAGVLYSACRTETGVRTLLQAVRGLGLSAVDGSAVPDSIFLDRRHGRITNRTSGRQDALLACAEGEGTETRTVAAGLRVVPILSDEQALSVARLAWRLEDHLGMPLDMEWAIDRKGRAFVLQVRPQPEHAGETWRTPPPRVAGARVLLEGGSRASGGVGFGEPIRVETDLDILRFPVRRRSRDFRGEPPPRRPASQGRRSRGGQGRGHRPSGHRGARAASSGAPRHERGHDGTARRRLGHGRRRCRGGLRGPGRRGARPRPGRPASRATEPRGRAPRLRGRPHRSAHAPGPAGQRLLAPEVPDAPRHDPLLPPGHRGGDVRPRGRRPPAGNARAPARFDGPDRLPALRSRRGPSQGAWRPATSRSTTSSPSRCSRSGAG